MRDAHEREPEATIPFINTLIMTELIEKESIFHAFLNSQPAAKLQKALNYIGLRMKTALLAKPPNRSYVYRHWKSGVATEFVRCSKHNIFSTSSFTPSTVQYF